VASPAEIAPATTVGEVHLTVSDLQRSMDYYGTAVGLGVLERVAGSATLGVGSTPLLVLVEEPGARPSAGHGHTGLFHFALLVPERADLAAWLAHAAQDRVALTGLSDHFVSEALYLSDPDGHGIEIYWDRPRHVWEGQVAERMTTLPLDVDDLIATLDETPRQYAGLPPGTVMGHVHLRVADIDETVAFYRDVLGFELVARLGNQAAFLSAGGYHHHIGLNTWESRGGEPPPRGTTGLYHAAILYPTRAALSEALRRLSEAGVSLRGAADHGVSIAFYLDDPDRNGLELYWDRPREEWPRNADGTYAMVSDPVDMAAFMAGAARE
jgi:catechol 2,3-dioxygenase